MTERLYYTDSFLSEFDARVVETQSDVVVLDRTAFYPTSGGQLFDTGWLEAGKRFRVREVTERDDGTVLHRLEVNPGEASPQPGARVHGAINVARRRDHMQQHTGQHILSAVFVELFSLPTVSFHMGDESCTVDLNCPSLSAEQVAEAERRANQVVTDDVAVEVRFATPEEAQAQGVRKLPTDVKDQLRLIDIQNLDLTACGGTHVQRTGQVGPILIRKVEKVKQGMRVEFLCGNRAIAAARRDYEALTAAAGLLSTHVHELAAQIRKTLEEIRAAHKQRERLLEELAQAGAAVLLAEQPVSTESVRLIARAFADRDLGSIKLLAQKLTAGPGVVALLASTVAAPVLVFAQSADLPHDMSALMKEAVAAAGGRGGGSRTLAQGGVPDAGSVELILQNAAAKLRAAD